MDAVGTLAGKPTVVFLKETRDTASLFRLIRKVVEEPEKKRTGGRRCVFGLRELPGDPCPCSGTITRHHVQYRCEGGQNSRGNLVPVCLAHQRFIHQKPGWGDEDFKYLVESFKKEAQHKDRSFIARSQARNQRRKEEKEVKEEIREALLREPIAS